MKLSDVPASARFLDVDGIPVVVLPDASCLAFSKGSDESRPYPNSSQPGSDMGDRLSREEFSAWLRTGFNRFDVRQVADSA